MTCIAIASIATIGLTKGTVVEPTRSDFIRVLAHQRGSRKVKETIIQASFREYLKRGIILAMSEEAAKSWKVEVKA
jgi:hypothetical protein